MERPVVADSESFGRQLAQVVVGGPDVDPALLSRFWCYRDGDRFVLRDKETDAKVAISLLDIENDMLETNAGFLEAIERRLMAKACVSCMVELGAGEFGLCPSCQEDRVHAVLGARARLA